jgi:deoxyribonuclease-1
MEKTYGINLSKQDRKLFEAWDRAYPVTERECERDRRIFKVQGDHNPFVFEKCQEPVTPADPAAPAEPAAPVDSLKANN